MNVADWTAVSRATALASLQRHLRCLACNGPVEQPLMCLRSSAFLTPPASARRERPLRCLACNGPVEKSLMVLGSLRCLACRDVDAPLDPALFDEMLPEGDAAVKRLRDS